MRLLNVVAVLFVLPGRLFVSEVHLGDDVQVGPELERLRKRVRYQPTALEAQQHGLVDDPAQRD